VQNQRRQPWATPLAAAHRVLSGERPENSTDWSSRRYVRTCNCPSFACWYSRLRPGPYKVPLVARVNLTYQANKHMRFDFWDGGHASPINLVITPFIDSPLYRIVLSVGVLDVVTSLAMGENMFFFVQNFHSCASIYATMYIYFCTVKLVFIFLLQ
jgi:hypothetical protein